MKWFYFKSVLFSPHTLHTTTFFTVTIIQKLCYRHYFYDRYKVITWITTRKIKEDIWIAEMQMWCIIMFKWRRVFYQHDVSDVKWLKPLWYDCKQYIKSCDASSFKQMNSDFLEVTPGWLVTCHCEGFSLCKCKCWMVDVHSSTQHPWIKLCKP